MHPLFHSTGTSEHRGGKRWQHPEPPGVFSPLFTMVKQIRTFRRGEAISDIDEIGTSDDR